MKRAALISVTLIGVFAFSSPAKEWCGIVPLRSTRADVERVLKVKAERCGGNACLYDLPDKTVFVFYAAEPTCRNDDLTTSWKVPRDTVIQLTVHFITPQSFAALDIDVTKYDRAPDKELRGVVYLSDYAQGVRMNTSGDTVRAITYYPPPSDDKLRCQPKPLARVAFRPVCYTYLGPSSPGRAAARPKASR